MEQRDRELMIHLAKEAGLQFVDLNKVDIDKKLLSILASKIAKQYKAFPVFETKREIQIAVGDPLDVLAQDDIRTMLGLRNKEIVFRFADPDQIDDYIGKHYGDKERAKLRKEYTELIENIGKGN